MTDEREPTRPASPDVPDPDAPDLGGSDLGGPVSPGAVSSDSGGLVSTCAADAASGGPVSPGAAGAASGGPVSPGAASSDSGGLDFSGAAGAVFGRSGSVGAADPDFGQPSLPRAAEAGPGAEEAGWFGDSSGARDAARRGIKGEKSEMSGAVGDEAGEWASPSEAGAVGGEGASSSETGVRGGERAWEPGLDEVTRDLRPKAGRPAVAGDVVEGSSMAHGLAGGAAGASQASEGRSLVSPPVVGVPVVRGEGRAGGGGDGSDEAETEPLGRGELLGAAGGSGAVADSEQMGGATPGRGITEMVTSDTDGNRGAAESVGGEAESGPGGGSPGVPEKKRALSTAGALIAVLLALFGFTFVVQLQSNDEDSGLASARQEDLVRILSDLDARDQRLQQEINGLEESQRQLTSGVAGRQVALAEAQKRADELGLLSGTLPAKGPGLKIAIDPKGAPIKASAILNAVQELRGAGGEVMQLVGDNGVAVRIVASSYFVDADGGDIVVDGKQLSGPYTLWVIGVPSTMQTALQIPGGVVASVSQDGGNVTMEQRTTVDITAVRQAASLQYARPVS